MGRRVWVIHTQLASGRLAGAWMRKGGPGTGSGLTLADPPTESGGPDRSIRKNNVSSDFGPSGPYNGRNGYVLVTE